MTVINRLAKPKSYKKARIRWYNVSGLAKVFIKGSECTNTVYQFTVSRNCIKSQLFLPTFYYSKFTIWKLVKDTKFPLVIFARFTRHSFPFERGEIFRWEFVIWLQVFLRWEYTIVNVFVPINLPRKLLHSLLLTRICYLKTTVSISPKPNTQTLLTSALTTSCVLRDILKSPAV